jgi:cell division protein FtsN
MTLYKRVASDSLMPDSIRAQANNQLANAGQARGQHDSTALYHDRNALRFPADTPTAAPSPVAGSAAQVKGHSGPRFALQAGAFGSNDNAVKLKEQLVKEFPDTRVAALDAAGAATMFRVLVGAFGSKEEAQEFGEKRLKAKGLSYCVVETAQ